MKVTRLALRAAALTVLAMGVVTAHGCSDDETSSGTPDPSDATVDGTTTGDSGSAEGGTGADSSTGTDASPEASSDAGTDASLLPGEPCQIALVEDAGDAGADADADAGPTFIPAAAYQIFTGGMVGCSGKIAHPERAGLCNQAAGCVPCGLQDWLAKYDGAPPTHNYWLNERLRYAGPRAECRVLEEDAGEGSACVSSASPMRVCVDSDAGRGQASIDPSGNACNWSTCYFGPPFDAGAPDADAGDAASELPNMHFGGCDGNLTAGTLCCCQ